MGIVQSKTNNNNTNNNVNNNQINFDIKNNDSNYLNDSFVNISPQLLNQIFIQLDEKSDRIHFNLSLLKSYQKQKDTYFFYNSDLLSKSLIINDNIQITSNDDRLEMSVSIKSQFSLFIGNNSEIVDEENKSYEYTQNYEQINKLDIPSKVTEIVFSKSFNLSLETLGEKLVNSNVKKIKFGREFNHPLCCLPSNLESLLLGDNFNHPIKIGQLPTSVKELQLGRFFQSLPSSDLPANLKVLSFSNYVNSQVLNPQHPLPSSLEEIVSVELDWLNTSTIKNNPSLTRLGLCSEKPQELLPSLIPSNIKTLNLGSHYILKSGSIPSGIKTLTLGLSCFQEEEGALPMDAHFDHLDLGSTRFVQPIKANSLPPNIKSLKLPSAYQDIFEVGSIPRVETLQMPNYYPLEISKGVIPDSVTKLSIGFGYEKPLFEIPKSVETLDLADYGLTIKKGVISKSVKKVMCSVQAIKSNNSLVESLPKTVESILIYQYFKDNIAIYLHRIEKSDRFLVISCNHPTSTSIFGGFIQSSSLRNLFDQLTKSM